MAHLSKKIFNRPVMAPTRISVYSRTGRTGACLLLVLFFLAGSLFARPVTGKATRPPPEKGDKKEKTKKNKNAKTELREIPRPELLQRWDPASRELYRQLEESGELDHFTRQRRTTANQKWAEKLRAREKRKIRGFWQSGWYNFSWTVGGLSYAILGHIYGGRLTAKALSDPGANYQYRYARSSGPGAGGRALVSVSPFLTMKASQLIWGSWLLYDSPHPAVSLPLHKITWYSMYHWSFFNFTEPLFGGGDLTRFSRESGFPFGVLFVAGLAEWFLNILFLSDQYQEAYEKSLYRPEDKKLSQTTVRPSGRILVAADPRGGWVVGYRQTF